MRDFKQLAIEAARAADEKKAVDLTLLDLTSMSDIADYMVILTAESSSQMRAIDDAVEAAMDVHQIQALHRQYGNRWLALDYGGFMLHIFLPEAREFYRLESMWEDPKYVAWEQKVAKAPKASKTKKITAPKVKAKSAKPAKKAKSAPRLVLRKKKSS